MNHLTLILVLGMAILTAADAAAILPGGCVDPGNPPTPSRPVAPLPGETVLVALPVTHEVHGVRTAGFQTCQMRVFELRASGYLSYSGPNKQLSASRYSRSRAPVSMTLEYADWGKQVEIVVDQLSDFHIVIQSENPLSFDSFTFEGVHPGYYVFTLDQSVFRKDPVDVDLEYHGRVLGTRTVYPVAMDHPAQAPAQKTRSPQGDLQVTHSR